MIATSLKSSFLDTCPKVWADNNHLYARTSMFYRVLNLFFYSRTVVVDRIKKYIEIKIKTFWFFTSKKYIPLDDIEYIDIQKRETGNMGGLFQGIGTQDIVDKLYVQVIRKKSPHPVNLFRFVGDPGYDNRIGQYLIDTAGMQYEKALHYAELVAKYTASQLFKDKKIEYDVKVDHYKCLKCGHESPSKIKCIYCGNQEMEKVS